MHRPTSPAPFLLAADIDGTLLGDPPSEAAFTAFVEQHPAQVILALVTGRSLPTILPLIQARRLPQPAFICADVGTELFDCRDPSNALGRAYAARAASSWDLPRIYALGMGEGVTIQEFPDGQPRFQAGFYWDGSPRTLELFRQRLASMPGCAILPSYDYYIDVLPASMGKGQAVLYLQQVLGLPAERVVVAGDTGNDAQMFQTGLRGILPANALDELKQIAVQPWHYPSPFAYAQGVLDGLVYHQMAELQ